MKIDLEKIRQAVNENPLVANGYVCKICRVEDVPDKQCLKVYYDIAEGEFENYFLDNSDPCGFYPGIFYACYKSTALTYFSRFVRAVEASNPGYTFQGEEKGLEDKLIGLVLRQEEYLNKYQTKEIKLGVAEYVSIDAIREGAFEVPGIKRLN